MNHLNLASRMFDSYHEFHVGSISARTCKHSHVLPILQEIVNSSGGTLTMFTEGQSLEGRSIHRLAFGTGHARILLWSQMHGDEPTATLALLDIFRLLATRRDEKWVRRLAEEVSIQAIPLLNPDGAERFRRYTAADIDLNRDAIALRTPEANLLRNAQRTFRPEFGFNLHDQSLASVGPAPKPAAMSLLAPALDQQRSTPLVRIKAMRVGALVAKVVSRYVPGHIATYDDAFDPRAFGDSMQSWGTSTLLIESGQWPGDPEKETIRKLNAMAILTALKAIGDETYQTVDIDDYRLLVPNGKRMFDILVRGVTIRRSDGWTAKVDIGFLVQPVSPKTTEIVGPDSQFSVKEVGDLSPFGALEIIDASARTIDAATVRVDSTMTKPQILNLLQL